MKITVKNWKYKFNPKKCHLITQEVNEYIPGNAPTEIEKQQIQSEFENKLPPKFQNTNIIAPLSIKEWDKKCNQLKGTNLNGDAQYWNIQTIDTDIRLDLVEYMKANTDRRLDYHIHWKAKRNDDIAWIKHNVTMYKNPIHYSYKERYLGIILHDQNTQCIISDRLTNSVFMQKLKSRIVKIQQDLTFKFAAVGYKAKIRLLNTFLDAYFQIFGQVMPENHIQYIEETCIDAYTKLLNIWKASYNHNQILHFIGRLTCEQYIHLIKLMYMKKLYDSRGSTLLHTWMGKYFTLNIPI